MAEFKCGLDEAFPQEEELLEEKSLNLLKDSKVDQAFAEAKSKKKGGRKHKVKWMRRPMVMPEAILEFLDEDLRENAIRYLSNFFIEKREVDPINYNRGGFLLYSLTGSLWSSTQEVVTFYRKMSEETLNVRSIKRLANVLTLFQCIAANNGTRQMFVNACIPDYLIPLIQFECTIGVLITFELFPFRSLEFYARLENLMSSTGPFKSNVVEVCHIIVKSANRQ
ncbi:hypothetical protein KSP39_PZI013289 [Platanthera zijinensis]|uniref:Uncharacterized protein n=1 Tax=Platanthera zijinensis TaxID=2320716 RepID=A0AAP0BCT4_9ASPA